MARVLLSAMGGPVSVSIIQHLQDSGHTVLGIDCRDDAIGRHFCDRFHVCPLASEKEAYATFLTSIADEFDVFFPFVDEELIALVTAGSASNGVLDKTVLSHREAILTCDDKIRFQQAAIEKGLTVPPLAEGPPAVVKPAQGRGGEGVIAVDDPALLSHYKTREDLICQSLIHGDEYTIDALTDEAGNWIFGVARKRLVAKGVSVVGQIDMNPVVLDLARRSVAAFPFRGPINLQIILETGTGTPYLIEINPRLSGSIIFTALAGFDLLNAAIDLFFGRSQPTPQSIKDGLKIIRYWSEYCVE